MGFLFALLTIDAIALWQRVDMSFRSDVSLIWSIFAARIGVGVASSWWSGSGGFWRA